MSSMGPPEPDDSLTDEQRKAAIGELLALGAINAVRGLGHAEDRGGNAVDRDSTEKANKARRP